MALPIALRASSGLWMINGPPNIGSQVPFPRDTSSKCKVMVFSKDGSLFAWCNGNCVKIYDTQKNTVIQELDCPKASCLAFSPKGTLLVIWEPYTVDKETQAGVPNLHIYCVETGKCLRSLIQKKVTYWCPQFSDDEMICCRNVNNELQFFEDRNFDEIKTKLHLQKVAGYSLATAGPPYQVAGYVPGAKGQPSFVRIYKYPNFSGPNAALANRTFFKADKVEMLWNKTASAMLLLTTTETSESSYYGDQGLHFLGANGESSLVHLGKNGPVYHVEWSPKSTEFCVVYGFMPAKATIYNLKTEPVFDFGTGPRNFVFYNPQGNILCLCGFGNLHGNMEFWDVKQQKLICQTKSPDTTSFQWFPNGEHVLTATTTPRLRVGNGYRVWHYTGAILEQKQMEKGEELWEAFCQPAPEGKFCEKSVSYRPVQSEVQAPIQQASQQAYVPPSLRGQQNKPSTKLHEYEPASNMKQSQTDANKPASKNKKKKEARKARQLENENAQDFELPPAAAAISSSESAPSNTQPSTGDPEKDKRIRNLRKKLQQIDKLKEQQSAGKQLEKNQLDKLKTEASLLKELEQLQIS